MTDIARYFAEVGVKVDNSQLRKVDKYLKEIEKKFSKYGGSTGLGFGISNFTVDQKRLNLILGNALDVSSRVVSFEISRFTVDQSHLNRLMVNALANASAVASRSVVLRPNVQPHNQLTRSSVPQVRAQGSRSHIAAGAAGGGGGILARSYAPALALGLGGYGLSNLNQRNQQVVSAQLQSQAVVQQAGGTAGQGRDSFQYLRSEGNRIGFNYLDASGDYNKLISGLIGSGVSLGESQKVFSGFAELARVNKLDKTTQNRLFRALSQVAGKGKLQAEELTSQIAEALPGGTALFAQAYQTQLAAKGQGGGLVGQAAIAKLQADMKKGLVSSDILTYAGTAASARANAGGGLTAAQEASQAQQARFQNTISDLAVVASNSGVEEGFARIFKTLSQGLENSAGLVEALSQGFNKATQVWSELFLIPQDIQRLFDGQDSVVADWLWGKGKQGEETLASLIEIRDLFTNIKDLGKLAYDGWKQLFDLMDASSGLSLLGDMLPSVNKALSGLLELKKTGDAKAFAKTETEALSGIADAYTWLPRQALSLFTTPDGPTPEGGRPSLRGMLNNFGVNGFGSNENSSPALIEAQETLTRNQMNKAFDDPYYARAGIGDPFGLTAARYDNKINGDAIGAQYDKAAGSATTNNVSNVYNLDISFQVQGTNNGGVDFEAGGKTVAEWFKNELGTAAVNFPNNQ